MEEFQTQSLTDDKNLQGYIWRTEAAPRAVISLVHGFGEHSGRYAPMAEALNDAGIAMVTLDLRAHGRSEGKRGVVHNYENFYGDVDALIQKTRAEFPDSPHILMGHSMGGALVMNYRLARDLPHTLAYIITAPLLELTTPYSESLRPFMNILRKLAPNFTFGKPLPSDHISSLRKEAVKYENDPLIGGPVNAGLGLDMIDYGRKALARAKDWNAPLLLMHSHHDKITDCDASAEFAAQAQQVEFIAYDKAAHEIHNDVTRADVYKEIINFIEAQLAIREI